MLDFCWHKWHIIRQYTDPTIKTMAERPGYDPDLDVFLRYESHYKEKVCLKCEKYVDEITPRYEYHLEQVNLRRKETEKVEAVVARVKQGKKIWEGRGPK